MKEQTAKAERRERNRRYYLKNRDEILKKVKKRRTGDGSRHLAVVGLKASDKGENPSETSSENQRPDRRSVPWSVIFRALLVAGLLALMTAMQVSFYREHDVMPELAWPIAIASELAFISLVTMKFRRGFDWLRIGVYLVFYGYFCASLSFQVFHKSRTEALEQTSANLESLERQLEQAQRSLEIATRGRSWDNMKLFGSEVAGLRRQISEAPPVKTFGVSDVDVLIAEATLLIVLRALLMAASAFNILRLREILSNFEKKSDGVYSGFN